jgi:hypothetical protein
MCPRGLVIICAISAALFAIPLFAAETLEFDCQGLVAANHNGNPSTKIENFHVTVNWDEAKSSLVITGDTQLIQASPETSTSSINLEIVKQVSEADQKWFFNYRENAKSKLVTHITLDPQTGKFAYWKNKREKSSLRAEGICRPIQSH